VAHGRAGVAIALSRWAAAAREPTGCEIAAELIRFDVDAIDTRTDGRAPSRGNNATHLGWCRGSLGVALAALQSEPGRFGLRKAWFRRIADDIIAGGVEGPLCLCHGVLGQLEFLTAMAERGMLQDHLAAAAWRRAVLGRIIGDDWVSDTGHRLESPGMMLGLAGTGYSLLRFSRPHSIPSILTLS
jgi:lantibiotic modifying enzyme